MNSRPPLISLDNVTFSYRPFLGLSGKVTIPVVQSVSLNIHRGDRLGVFGRNGEGKTTLLRILGGIISPDAGQVTVAPKTSVSLLSLGSGLNGALTGKDNVVLTAVLMGRTEEWARNFLPQIKEFSELGEAFDRPVYTYSAGMKSRLAFSTAINLDVDVLLVDEVLAVGDASFRKKAEAAMAEKIEMGQTLVLVSHSAADIKRICQKAIWLDNGSIIESGTVDVVAFKYSTAR